MQTKMSLKTHTAYPEVRINPHGVFTVKLINAAGKEVFSDMGAGEDQKDINERVAKLVNAQEPNYRKGAARKVLDFIKGES